MTEDEEIQVGEIVRDPSPTAVELGDAALRRAVLVTLFHRRIADK